MIYYACNTRPTDRNSKLTSIIQTVRDAIKNEYTKSVIRPVILLSIFAYLIFRLSKIGWNNILQSLPSSPTFYLLSIAFVLLPIVAERLAFPIADQSKRPPKFKVFVRKHVINKAVMNYAGEGYFIHSLTRTGELNLQSAAIIVKNLALTRTFAANLWVIMLIAAGLILGNANVFTKITQVSPVLAFTVGVITLGFCLGSIIFFRKLTHLKYKAAGKIVATYLIRSILAGCILVAQWNLALPGNSLEVWIPFLIVFFVSKKSPIGGDLVFVSVALTLPGLSGEGARVAAMLLTIAATLQLIYALGFVATSKLSSGHDYNLAQERSHKTVSD